MTLWPEQAIYDCVDHGADAGNSATFTYEKEQRKPYSGDSPAWFVSNQVFFILNEQTKSADPLLSGVRDAANARQKSAGTAG